jgi:Ca2+-binding EF-hand superfamily protein
MLKRKRIRIVVWRLAIIYYSLANDSILNHSLASVDGTSRKSSTIQSSSSSACFSFQPCTDRGIKQKRQLRFYDNDHKTTISSQHARRGIYLTRSVTCYTLMNVDQELDNFVIDNRADGMDETNELSETTTYNSRQQFTEYNDECQQPQQEEHYFAYSIPLPHFLDESSLRVLNEEINPFDLARNFQSNTNLDTIRNFFSKTDENNDSVSDQIEDNTDPESFEEDDDNNTPLVTLRSLWRRRDARSAEEGIRRERTSSISIPTTTKLSDVLDKARGSMMKIQNRRVMASRKFAARTISGIISALAENVDGLEVQVTANPNTPFWKKHVDVIAIQFSKLGFKPLQISGGIFEPSQVAHHYQARSLLGIYDDFLSKRIKNKKNGSTTLNSTTLSNSKNVLLQQSPYDDDDETTGAAVTFHMKSLDEEEQELISPTADEAFDRIDVDNSGSLDRDELVQALNLAATASFEDVNDDSKAIIEDLATDLVALYDINGDGVVDRKEYKSMVADMAELRRKQIEMESQDELKQQQKKLNDQFQSGTDANSNPVVGTVTNAWNFVSSSVKNVIGVNNSADEIVDQIKNRVQVVNSIDVNDPLTKTLGSLTITDIKMDMRRLFFGAVPVLKHITPGGPLILEPFTVTVNGSFNRHDILKSALLDAGLRRLVMRVLRIRVGFIRDFIEGSVFYGRSWRMFGEAGPKVEVPQLTEIEFDENNKLIITGRAKVRTSPNAPVVEQAFKVRTRIGTGQNGRFIRLEEPELALVIECPKGWEKK